jgi:hypothetical protein
MPSWINVVGLDTIRTSFYFTREAIKISWATSAL